MKQHKFNQKFIISIALLCFGLFSVTKTNAQTTFTYTGTMQTWTVPPGITVTTPD